LFKNKTEAKIKIDKPLKIANIRFEIRLLNFFKKILGKYKMTKVIGTNRIKKEVVLSEK
jgi:hypothetical protein